MRQFALASLVAVLTAGFSQAAALEYFAETSKDFGNTPRGPLLTHYFTVQNKSNQVVTLGQPRVSCGCVSAYAVKNQLAPGESSAVVAYMDTKRIPQAGVPRIVTVFVMVQTGAITEEVQLRVQAVAREDLVLSNESFAFGNVRKGQGGAVSTRITFYGAGSAQITEAVSSGVYVKAAFSKLPSQGTESVYEVTATLDPACPVGNWMAEITVKSSIPGMEKLPIRVTVNVVAPIDVKPEAARFGDMFVGKSYEQKIILQASQPFKIVEVKGAPAGLELTPAGPAARPVHILTLTFVPKTAGELKGNLEIITDHAEQTKVLIPLSGLTAKADKAE